VIDASTQLLPAELAPYTVESLYADHGDGGAWGYWLMLAGVAGAVACLPFVEVDVSVHAVGQLRPATDRIELRAAVSGHIARVLAQDNDPVRTGQPLLVLASRDLDERLNRNRALQARCEDLIADLGRVTAESAAPGADAGTPAPSEACAGIAGIATPTLRGEHAQLLAQLRSNRLDETRARAECDRFEALAARGIASRRDLERARYELERLQADAVVIWRQAAARWQLRMRDEETAFGELASEEKRLREEQTHFTIHAPVDGMLIGFTGWSAGGFVSAGQSLGAVSPSDQLLVEAHVSPRDIGLVAPGQAAKIQVDAYPYTQWGLLDGTVTSVSGDLAGPGFGSGPASPMFKVLLRPAAAALHLSNGTRGELKKGLTVQIRFLVARRTLFQLLHEGADAWFNPQGALRPGPPVTRLEPLSPASRRVKKPTNA
jgi:multidrug resistance efflux pump